MAKTHQRVFALVGALLFLATAVAGSVAVVWQIKKDNETSKAANQLNQPQENAVQNQPLDGYQSQPFDKSSITQLKVETLMSGNGKEATASSTVVANYFGWTSDGKIFDSSKKSGTTTPATFPLNGVIPGWTQGLTGVKEGSVVKLTIPANLAYGEQGSPPNIGPNEPLVFIVQLTQVK